MAQREGGSQSYAVMLCFSPTYLMEFIQHENLSGNAFYEQLLAPTEEETLNTLQCLFVFTFRKSNRALWKAVLIVTLYKIKIPLAVLLLSENSQLLMQEGIKISSLPPSLTCWDAHRNRAGCWWLCFPGGQNTFQSSHFLITLLCTCLQVQSQAWARVSPSHPAQKLAVISCVNWKLHRADKNSGELKGRGVDSLLLSCRGQD